MTTDVADRARRLLRKMLLGGKIAEVSRTLAVPPPQTSSMEDFDPASSKQKRAVVISNCQCLPLAAWLTVLSADTCFDFWGVHLIDSAQREVAIKDFVENARSLYDFILAIPLSDDYVDLSTGNIVQTFDPVPVVRISNIYFSGFHPDQTYIGGLSQRVSGPLGDAHSRLAIYGFMNGLTVDQTAAFFSIDSYSRLGYLDEFAKSLRTLVERDSQVDVPVSRFLKQRLRSALCFYSFNHPTPTVFSTYATDVMRHLTSLGLARASGLPDDPSLCSESLAGSVIFPVYPEIATHHGAPHIGSYAFKPDGAWVNPMTLRRFLKLEFEAFEAVGRETLGLSHAAQLIAAHFPALRS